MVLWSDTGGNIPGAFVCPQGYACIPPPYNGLTFLDHG